LQVSASAGPTASRIAATSRKSFIGGLLSRLFREDSMPEFERKRDRMIEHLEAALVLADELKDGATGLLIETALDQARADRVARGREGRPQ
jgi:hypothetical protein